MYLLRLMLCLTLVALVKPSEWCYTGCDHSPSNWKEIEGSDCKSENPHQSPIGIVTSNVTIDQNLNNFTFVNFSSKYAIESITYNGHSVQCNIVENETEVSGGGLDGQYSVLQFHFHWGTETDGGSEHTVDDHRFKMEMHIVTAKKDMTEEEINSRSDGLAVLGFFIEENEDKAISEPWQVLTSYLEIIEEEGSTVNLNHKISIDDLIGDVDRSKYYRYNGSLTTPNCSEIVVWTVFHEPILVHKDLLNHFPKKTNLTNNYRPVQPHHDRHITASPGTPLPEGHKWCYDDHCDHSPAHWSALPGSHCDGESQSPIDIETSSVTEDESLGSFNFTHFDDKHAIKSITNTGHTVKCILKDDAVEVSGGGLEHVYSTLQFHFHWGTESADSQGSEHTVDSKRYPMEMHIVNKRKDLTLEEAVGTADGLAVLGFFIEEEPNTGSEHDMKAWKTLTDYLSAIKNISSEVEVTHEISIDDLLGHVNRESYFRYSGSLTTPLCNEAVVWTVFKESIKVDHELMAMFPKHAGYHDVFRPRQALHSRKVLTTAAATVPGPVLFYLLLSCLFALFS
ncbi:PREDICTED: carbonic anhydrase 4-like [Cyprinodon variegatus]|uniref:carbonic anhydrase 4-like n=1 Tax=Cyprinodon variegatus TaxID=28743 RepID=UPI000742B49F|nr:PREDICTED: carbonic anhydrase 4-like [Cyprinodon variegatus]